MTTRSPKSDFLGHPRGLAYIVFTEAWERFSFYGMQALLVLYMTSHLLQPEVIGNVAGFGAFGAAMATIFGKLSIQALAAQIFGLYVGLIYITPVIGGLIGDRLTGRTRAVLIGAALMAIGHFMMVFETLFLAALAMIIFGVGLLKGNLAAQVGNLYADQDSRRDGAFTLYSTGINLGAFVAPLVCGTLGEFYGWHYGFAAAGVGMVVGIVIYLSGLGYLPPENAALRREKREALGPDDRRRVVAVLALLMLTSLIWIAQAQVWNIYPLWQRDFVDRSISDWTIPVTWFQSLDSLAALLLAPILVLYWRRQAKRSTEPSDLTKVVIGCLIYTGAFLLLSVGQLQAGDGKVALVWPIVFHFTCALAYLYAIPITLALVSRVAPASVNAMMLGAFYIGVFIGGIGSGWLARFYEPLGPAVFWAIHAGIVFVGAVSIGVLRPLLVRSMNEPSRASSSTHGNI